jgi:hypothetical protein
MVGKVTANTKENTARILKGQDPIQRLRCRLGWHRWTAWEILDRREQFLVPTMRCYCADCGMYRLEDPYSKSRKR